MRDDQLRLHFADDSRHLHTNRIIIGQQTIGIIQHFCLAAQLGSKVFSLLHFLFAVFCNVSSFGGTFFPCRQGQGRNAAALQGAGS